MSFLSLRATSAAVACAAALLMAAPTAHAQDAPTAAQVATFVEAVAAVGCEVSSPEQAGAVETSTGFDNATLSAVLGALLGDGRAELLDAGGFVLRTGPCS